VQELTYSGVGGTEPGGQPPAGYRVIRRCTVLGNGLLLMARATEALMTFDVFRAAGLRPEASARRAHVGVTVTTRLGLGPMRIPAPCRVVWSRESATVAGFGYGTLPGHPARGEEAFILERDAGDTVMFVVTSFSRPQRWFMRAAGPLGHATQVLMLRRYATALRRCLAAGGTATGP
jgi:uncharacterized protein (UPF0548 family)